MGTWQLKNHHDEGLGGGGAAIQRKVRRLAQHRRLSTALKLGETGVSPTECEVRGSRGWRGLAKGPGGGSTL